MVIAFRTDSGIHIATGHVYRCLSLASYFKNQEIHFITKDFKNNIGELIIRNGFPIHLIPFNKNKDCVSPSPESWFGEDYEQDALKMINIIDKIKPDILIVDQYAVNHKWEKIIRPYVKNLVVIDDIISTKHDCDILINQQILSNDMKTINIQRSNLNPSCKLLCGTEYLLLSKNILDSQPKKWNSVKKINVFTSGSDQKNDTLRILRICEKIKKQYQAVSFDIIITSTNPSKNEIKEICNVNNFNYYESIDNFSEVLSCADLCIGGGGMTLYERIFYRIPSIILALADNQLQGIRNMSELNCIEYIGTNKNDYREIMYQKLTYLLENPGRCKELSENCKKINFTNPDNLVEQIIGNNK